MKRITISIIVVLLMSLTHQLLAQKTEWQLYGHNNGSDVRLIWTRSEWPMEVEGIVVKRRVNGAAWQTLTSTAVYPGVSVSKKLDNVTNDPARLAAIKKKVSDNPTQFNIDSLEFLRIISRGSGLKMFMFTLTKDYDLALITGLGYEDHNVSAVTGAKVEYAIFTKENGVVNATAAASWSYVSGKAPEYDLKGSGTVKARKAKKEVKVTFSVASDKIINAKIIYGFNVYRTIQGKSRELLTKSPVMANVYDPVCKVPVTDTLSDVNQKVVYELAPVTLMGWETTSIRIIYDPLQFPDAFVPQLLSQYKEGDKSIAFTYSIPENVRPFVDSIQLQEFNGATDYFRIRSYSPSSTNFYIAFDSTRTYPAEYIFRILVYLKTEEEPVKSPDTKVLYIPNMNFEAVSNINGQFIKEGSDSYILLKWSPVAGAAGYNLFLMDNETGKMFFEGTYGIIKATEFRYPVLIQTSKSYTFSVAAVNAQGRNAGELKYITTVVTPSQYLLRVWFKEAKTIQDSLIYVSWTYKEPDDVVGYRLYENGNLVTDENVLKKGRTEWVSSPRRKGRYLYEIEAVTMSGVSSPRSETRTIEITK